MTTMNKLLLHVILTRNTLVFKHTELHSCRLLFIVLFLFFYLVLFCFFFGVVCFVIWQNRLITRYVRLFGDLLFILIMWKSKLFSFTFISAFQRVENICGNTFISSDSGTYSFSVKMHREIKYFCDVTANGMANKNLR